MNTILIIDDEERIRSIFRRILQENGYNVLEATTGNAGLELAQKHLPDLILTDIAMPNGDGQTVLKHIRHDPALSNKQVVLMTGDPNLVTPRKGMEEGADDFLIKPVSMEALLSCVEARLKRAQIHWRVEDRMLAQLRSSVHSSLPHEFFTPLAGIIGLADILRTGFATLSKKEIKDLHNDIYHSALRLHRTLKNYLLLLELEDRSKESAPLPDPVSLKECEETLLAAIKETVYRAGRDKDILIQMEDCMIRINPADLTMIVEELLDNACKFSHPGTPISVHFGSDGILVISDVGRGMTAEEIKQIGAFRQFDRKRHEQQGLGLGLTLVQKLTSLCRAHFSIESILSQGTQVKVAFKTSQSK